jgi:HrpA-like RNA helicase
MATLPLDPPLARCLLASFEHRCASEVIDLIALLEHSDTLLINTISTRELAQEARRKFIHRDGDHLVLLNILKAYQSATENCPSHVNVKVEQRNWCKENFINPKAMGNVLESRKQLRDRCKRLGLDWSQSSREDKASNSESFGPSAAEEDSSPILCSLLAGLSTQLAIRQPDQSYINPLTKVVRILASIEIITVEPTSSLVLTHHPPFYSMWRSIHPRVFTAREWRHLSTTNW